MPFAIREDLAQEYEAEMRCLDVRWVQWLGYTCGANQKNATFRTSESKAARCGDYSVAVNPQLEVYRHPLPLAEDLNKLDGGYGFTNIDLADAYNQINLARIAVGLGPPWFWNVQQKGYFLSFEWEKTNKHNFQRAAEVFRNV